ncbi:MAG: hypothetical protein M1830_007643 [Pleopsidium flavum]|nr:MAG: hypothetical protein M1830_007643 [Pleopsidium flavum]
MEWYPFHQGLVGVNAYGTSDIQLDRLTIYLGHRDDMYAIPCDSCYDDLSVDNSDSSADCTPYLLQLGLTKSRTSLVWIAGPLSGLIMQPVVGVIADRSRSKWGRRRPFMIGGAIIVGLCLLVLGWTKEIVGLFITEPRTSKHATIALAVLSIYAVDFAINAGTSQPGKYISEAAKDLFKSNPHAEASSLIHFRYQNSSSVQHGVTSRMVAIGHLVGYGAGTLDLVEVFGTTLGDTQFKQLTVIAAAALLFAVGVTSYAVKERILISARDSDAKSGAVRMITQILRTTFHLPARIQAICWVQFWAWIGWFPFLFYSTTWVGETYFRYDAPKTAHESKDTLGDIGRVGSLSLIVFSIITFAGSVLLPWVVRSPEDDKPGFTPRPPPSIAPIVKTLSKFKPDLVTAWMISHLIFAGAMSLAPFVTSLRSATILVSICGIPWALASWAPFAFMGVEINKLGPSPQPTTHNNTSYQPLSPSTDSLELSPFPSTLHLNHPTSPSSTSTSTSPPQSITITTSSSTGELAGIYLGILNLFTTLPQFVGTFISMIVFSILEPGTSPELAAGEGEVEVGTGGEGWNAIAVCLFVGAVSAVGAAVATGRLRRVR